ncbi:MAG: hypothetical protein LBR41_01525 [Rickettsiales bacterium]|jgi:hypothetical protein|nr:hypothetical protein [Rickettsiales bacterium]
MDFNQVNYFKVTDGCWNCEHRDIVPYRNRNSLGTVRTANICRHPDRKLPSDAEIKQILRDYSLDAINALPYVVQPGGICLGHKCGQQRAG